MRDGFLKPRDDIGGGSQALFRQVAAHFVAKPHLNAAVPKPADLDINFTLVNLLKFDCQIHGYGALLLIWLHSAKASPT
jgi:hypothetical protein